MISLNKKGLTTIELLLSFIIVMIVILGMFNILFNFKENSRVNTVNAEINTYKSKMTKLIHDELLNDDKYIKIVPNCIYDGATATCFEIYNDSSTKRVIIKKNSIILTTMNGSSYTNLINYPLPSSENYINNTKINTTGTFTIIKINIKDNTATEISSDIVIYAKTEVE